MLERKKEGKNGIQKVFDKYGVIAGVERYSVCSANLRSIKMLSKMSRHDATATMIFNPLQHNSKEPTWSNRWHVVNSWLMILYFIDRDHDFFFFFSTPNHNNSNLL